MNSSEGILLAWSAIAGLSAGTFLGQGAWRFFKKAFLSFHRKKNNFLQRRWIRQASGQWADGLLFLSGAARSGYSVDEALTLLLQEGPIPLRDFLQKAEGYGAALSAEARIDLWFQGPGLDFPKAVLMTALGSGGMASGLLADAAKIIRQREAHRGRVRAHAAEAKLSALIAGASPFVFLGLSAWSSPEMAAEFFASQAGALTFLLIGILSSGGLILVYRMAAGEENRWSAE